MGTSRTRLELHTSPNAMIAHKPLSTHLGFWLNFASKVEKALLPKLKKEEVILWTLFFNWKPDDDVEVEMMPQYQPLTFGSVNVINSESLWRSRACSFRFEFNSEGIVVYKPNDHIIYSDDEILTKTVAQLS